MRKATLHRRYNDRKMNSDAVRWLPSKSTVAQATKSHRRTGNVTMSSQHKQKRLPTATAPSTATETESPSSTESSSSLPLLDRQCSTWLRSSDGNADTSIGSAFSQSNFCRRHSHNGVASKPHCWHWRDNNLLRINFLKLFLLIWLVINQNVYLVLSDDKLNNFNNATDQNINWMQTNNKTQFDILSDVNGGRSRQGIYDEHSHHDIISDDDILLDNHFTSTWAVHIPGGVSAADRVAAEHGFRNLGKVSDHLCLFNSINSLLFDTNVFGSLWER